MTDSSSFSSLLALVDSHLSKTTIQVSRSEDASVSNRIPIASLIGSQQPGSLSDTRLSLAPGQRLPLPTFNVSGSPIQNVLADQLANMFKAKELRRQQEEEKQQLVEEMRRIKLEKDNDVIDLMQAIQSKEEIANFNARPLKEVDSISSSLELLFEPKFIDCNDGPKMTRTPESLLPCKTDMSYILGQKIRKGKCSTFGKVLTSRLKPVAAPYLREKIESKVVRFDFSTQSPCDCIKEKLRRPTVNSSYRPDIFSIF